MKILHSVTASTNSSNSLISDVTALLKQSDEIIANHSGEFDPFSALDGTEDMSQRLYGASVNFQAAIQTAIDEYREATSFYVGLKYD